MRRNTRGQARRGVAKSNNDPSLLSWIITILFSAVLGCSLYFAYSAWHDRGKEQMWPIQHIVVKGHYANVDVSPLRQILSHDINGDLLGLSLAKLGREISAISWVDGVQLIRKLPSTLIVVVNEKKPVAHWNKSTFLDSKGQVFSGLHQVDDKKLVQLSGPDDEVHGVLAHYLFFKKAVKPLSLKIASVQLSNRLSWTVVTASGMQIQLGQKNTVDKMRRFVNAYPYLLKNNKHNPVTRVDLRYPHGMAVRFSGDRA